MAYNIGGINIENLAETAPTSDTRNSSSWTTSTLMTFGGQTYQNATGRKFIMNSEGYIYSGDANNGKYRGAGQYNLSRCGCLPKASYAGRRWDSSTAGTYYVNKFSDGEVWVSTTFNSRSGTRIGTAAENIQYVFIMLIGPGGGGGGGNGTKAGGGGGGGSFAFLCHRLVEGRVNRIYIGGGGSAGARNSNGVGSGNCQFSTFTDINNLGSSGVTTVNAMGGGGGQSGGNDGGGGGGGSVNSYDSSNINIHRLDERTGTSGGSRGGNNGGSTPAYSTQNYSPEGNRLDYGQGGGGGHTGGSGSGGGGGWFWGHNGGSATSAG